MSLQEDDLERVQFRPVLERLGQVFIPPVICFY